MAIITVPGEFGRHFDVSTGAHCWDGRDGGLDFDVWAYENHDGSFEVVVQQMLPPPMNAPGVSTTWVAHLVDGEPIVFQEGGSIILFPTVPRVVFESLPRAAQDQIWDAACENFLFPDGREHRYDLATGIWSPVDDRPGPAGVVQQAIRNVAVCRRVICWLDGDRILIGDEHGEHLYDVSGRVRPGGFVDDAYDVLEGTTALVPDARSRTELEATMYAEGGFHRPEAPSIIAELTDWDGDRFTLDVGAAGVGLQEAADPPESAGPYFRLRDATPLPTEAGEGRR